MEALTVFVNVSFAGFFDARGDVHVLSHACVRALDGNEFKCAPAGFREIEIAQSGATCLQVPV